MSSNISGMEKQIDNLTKVIMSNLFNREYSNTVDIIRDFMRMSLDSLKDLHEENCKLWKEIAKMKGEI